MSSRSLEVKIELGHKAVLKDKPTSEGYTHDWTVFVRGPEGCKIENFVEKVVFKLHESFPKARRTLRDPPYQVSESGYAGFNMPIIVYFKTKEEPKKLQFIYDLYLSMDGKPLNNIRCEKLTFHNPPEDFCSKLFKGGATIKDTSAAAAAAAAAPVTAVSPAKKPPTPPQKKSPHLTGAPPASTQFSVLFGAPIIKGQDAKQDVKKEKRKDKKDKEYKRDKKDKGASTSGKDEKPKESVKSEKPEKLTLTLSTNGKPTPGHSSEVKKEVVREKKRDNSSSPSQREKDDLKRKKKKSSSHKDSPDSKKPRPEESMSSATPTNAALAPAPTPAVVAKPKKKSQSKESLTTTSPPPPPPPPLVSLNDTNDVEFTPSPPDQSRKSKTLKEVKNTPNSDDLKPSLPPPKSQAPRRVGSPAHAKKKRPASNSSALKAMIMEMDADGSSPESESEASRYKRLHALKAKIAKLPKEKMQIVVDIVEESGNFELNDESFDFDLHLADASTITRLQQLVS